MRKKKILFQSNYCFANTGFGRNAKTLLRYLYETGKYEIFHYACGEITESNPILARSPWKSFGCLPDDRTERESLKRDPAVWKLAQYGAYMLDEAITKTKPDVYISAEDHWGVRFALDRKWWGKIPSIMHVTLDSLPILPKALEDAKKIPNYWVWSGFAQREMTRLGYKNVSHVNGVFDTEFFFKKTKEEREALRKRFQIGNDAFIVGFVFRNQLRKSVPNLFEGYALWKKKYLHPQKPFLLLHTHFGEGWKIPRLAHQYGIPQQEILCTYICARCREFQIKNFSAQEQDCPFCGSKKSQFTANTSLGVSEEQLNDIYNLMNVYIHPFTSGGQEMPIQEAKLAELVTLVTNYSCGEDMCAPEAESLPLAWTKYTEFNTEFIKASTTPESIAKQLEKVWTLPDKERAEKGAKARKWVLENYSVEIVGKKYEEFIDSLPETTYNFEFGETKKNPDAIIPEIEDNLLWIKTLYKLILDMDVSNEDDGVKHWLTKLGNQYSKEMILQYFRQTAANLNKKNDFLSVETFLNPNDKKRVLYVMPETIGDVFISTALFESIRSRYPRPEWAFYVATKPQYRDVLSGNEFIDKVIDFLPEMENSLMMEGQGDHKGFFDVSYIPFVRTQRTIDYLHNGIDKIDFELRKQ